jgi:hypothetical protein
MIIISEGVEKNIPTFFIFMLEVLDEDYSVILRSLLKISALLLVFILHSILHPSSGTPC